jgi:hypothetical protein
MMRSTTLTHEFVEYIPSDLQDGMLYVSMMYATAVHKCCCGCGNKVVTPISPTDWQLLFNGVAVSLYPSIGNWSLDCRSHYWIEENRVIWAGQWTQARIDAGRAYDRLAKQRYHASSQTKPDSTTETVKVEEQKKSLWQKMLSLWPF